MLFLYKNLSMKKKETTTLFELFFEWVNNLLSSSLKHNAVNAQYLDVNAVLVKRYITIIEENKFEFNVKQEERKRVEFAVDKIFNSFKKSAFVFNIKDFFEKKLNPIEKNTQSFIDLCEFKIKHQPILNNENQEDNQLGLFYQGDLDLKNGDFIPAFGLILVCDKKTYLEMNKDDTRGITHSIPICIFNIENDVYYMLLGVKNNYIDEFNTNSHDIGVWYFANYTAQDSTEFKDLGNFNCVCKCITIKDKLYVGLEVITKIKHGEEILIYTHTEPLNL